MEKSPKATSFYGMNQIIPHTVNIHSLIPCNYRCGFCYAGFPGIKQKQMPQAELHSILRVLADAPLPDRCDRRKITFAGGEPMLSKTIVEDIHYAHSLGLVTSLVTNGSLLSLETIKKLGGRHA